MWPIQNWWARPVAVFGLLTALALSLTPLPSPWEGWLRDGCERVNCYCEALRDALVVQPVSTHSNLAFVLVGLLIVFAPPRASARPTYQTVFGLAVMAVGFGSWFYHASLTRLGEWFDLVGVYLLLSLMLLVNAHRLRPLRPVTLAALYFGINMLGGLQMVFANALQQVVFVGLFGGALLLEIAVWLKHRPRMQLGWLLAALATFALAAATWLADAQLPCDPASPFQWHGLWHALTATAAGFVFLYYRSEVEGI
ncbi:MAG: ceramidase domain-containing protein [Anaerolineales bacterium]|nr:ceramidase domain-containing protein [Anaerolineales bacterium]